MKSLKSKVILSAVVLIFALVATIGSTFAWFTVSNTVNVSSISLTVQSQDSLLIKVAAPASVATNASSHLTASQYASILTQANITAEGFYPGILSAQLKPVTAIDSTYTVLNGKSLRPLPYQTGEPLAVNVKRILGTALDLNIVDGSSDINTDGGGVVQMRFWVLSQGSVNRNLYLSELTVAGDTASQAVRLSVWAGDYGTANPTFIYGPAVDYSYEFISTRAGYFDVGSFVDPDWANVYTGTTLNGFNMISQLTKAYDGLGALAPNFMTDPSSATVNNTSFVITTLVPNTPQLITVTMYIEGWDAQTTNDIMLDAFTVAFAFSIV